MMELATRLAPVLLSGFAWNLLVSLYVFGPSWKTFRQNPVLFAAIVTANTLLGFGAMLGSLDLAAVVGRVLQVFVPALGPAASSVGALETFLGLTAGSALGVFWLVRRPLQRRRAVAAARAGLAA